MIASKYVLKYGAKIDEMYGHISLNEKVATFFQGWHPYILIII